MILVSHPYAKKMFLVLQEYMEEGGSRRAVCYKTDDSFGRRFFLKIIYYYSICLGNGDEIDKLYLGGHALTPLCDVGEDKWPAVSP